MHDTAGESDVSDCDIQRHCATTASHRSACGGEFRQWNGNGYERARRHKLRADVQCEFRERDVCYADGKPQRRLDLYRVDGSVLRRDAVQPDPGER